MRCDCHVHIVGPHQRYPQVAERTFLAGVAELADLQRRGAARGVSRFVVVQPSFYGTDNALLLETLDRLGAAGRGVAVVDPAATAPEALAAMHARGVRGLRINLYSPVSARRVGPPEAAFAALTAAAAGMEWHVQVIAPLPVLVRQAALLSASPVPVVIDHYGLYWPAAPADAAGRALLDIVRRSHVWVKLSAPYRVSDDPMRSRPDPAWLAALLAAAGGRCLWGSDWPHTAPHDQAGGPDVPLPYREIPYARLLDDFIAALPSPELAEAVLVDNPARLYGF